MIDDFRTMREIYPSIREDALFLPFLTFYLGRQGVTGLIIDTDSGQPDTEPNDKLNADLRALVPFHLYTWHVPFYGEDRIAIAAIPPLSKHREHAGVIRELRPLGESKGQLTVDPHFELYSGFEEGRPKQIPLEVRLYSETPAFQEYIKQDNIFLKELFVGTPTGEGGTRNEIIRSEKIQEYEGVHNLCNLPSDTRLDHSLVFQVDGYWSVLRREAMANQHAYLCNDKISDKVNQTIFDPFHLFQPTTRCKQSKQTRLDYFANEYYETRIDKDYKQIDRVPFMWDFGFLLCRKKEWEQASRKNLTISSATELKTLLGRDVTVKDVWEALPKAPPEKSSAAQFDASLNSKLRSWRVFLEACQVVAEFQSHRVSRRVPAFDLAVLSPDSVSCFVLEVWISEIYKRRKSTQSSKKLEEWWETWNLSDKTFKAASKIGLVDLLREAKPLTEIYGNAKSTNSLPTLSGYSLELYKTWLLLVDVLDVASFLDPTDPFAFKVDRAAHPEAIASRHWYKTACIDGESAGDGGHDNSRIPTRLPGHFSARGDWYLAAAAGSRSQRLSRRAIDILSSRRESVRRLQLGIGLPTRDVLDGTTIGSLRTRLSVHANENKLPKLVSYEELASLSGKSMGSDNTSEDEFYRLWRSGLKDYDRQARIWQKWLCRLFIWSHDLRAEHPTEWITGFIPYDFLEGNTGTLGPVSNFDSFIEFARMCDELIANLEQSTPLA